MPVETRGSTPISPASVASLPLLDRFPALRTIPRVELCDLPSPVEKLPPDAIGGGMWIKRDDLNAPLCGGNKARALEFLLGGVGPGDTVLTVGGAGSTHVLSTAIHAARLGATAAALRWRHDMNPVAEIVSTRIDALVPGAVVGRSTVVALARAGLRSLLGEARYIPLGGSTPVGVLGHVNAALELAIQIESGLLPVPEAVVLPVGSGGTAAGLLLGFAIAGLDDITVVGARVGPRIFVNRRGVLGLARRTARLIGRMTAENIPGVDPARLIIMHHAYGGAYGRPLLAADAAAAQFASAVGTRLDGTYSAKAFLVALDERRARTGPVVFWLTFDPRCLTC